MHGSFLLNRWKNRNWPAVIERVVFSLAAAFILCIPFYNGTMVNQPQKPQVLNRIEALAQAMTARQPLIGPMTQMNFGYGYGSTLFESNAAYLLPSFLRSTGMPLQRCLKVQLFVIFACMLYTSFGMASTVLKKDRITNWVTALLCASSPAVYTMLFNRSMLEDGCALVFVPSVISTLSMLSASKGKGWLKLAAEISLAFLFSPFYGAVLIGLSLLYCLLHFRSVISDKTDWIGAGLTVLLIGSLIICTEIPYRFLLSQGNWRVEGVRALLSRGVGLHDLLDVIPFSFDHMASTPGLVLLFLSWMVFRVRGKKRWKFVWECTVMGYVLVFLSTSMMPWSLFPLASFMKDPARLLPIACVLLAAGSGFVLSSYPFDPENRPYIRRSIAGLSAVMILMMINTQYHYAGEITGDYTQKQFSDDGIMMRNEDSLYNQSECGNGWYLPDSDYSWRSQKRRVRNNSSSLSFVETDGVMIADNAAEGTVVFPKIWYPGYRVVLVKDKDRIVSETEAEPGTGLVKAEIKSDVPVRVELRYETPAVFRTCRNVSAVMWILSVLISAGIRIVLKQRRKP